MKGLAVLACASTGVHWQNEPLTFGPFWILILWQIRKSVTSENRTPLWTTGVVLGLAVAAGAFEVIFGAENAPEIPDYRAIVRAGGDFRAASAAWNVEFDAWAAEHGAILRAFDFVDVGVMVVSALLLIFLVARHLLNRRRKESAWPEQSAPSP